MLAEPIIWRTYQSPRVSPSIISSVKVSVAVGEVAAEDHRVRPDVADRVGGEGAEQRLLAGAGQHGDGRRGGVVLGELASATLRPMALRSCSKVVLGLLALCEVLELEVVDRDAPLEERRQQRVVERVAEVARAATPAPGPSAGCCSRRRLSLPSTLVHVWCRSLWVCFHEAAGVTKSHSQVVEWMSGSRIQSHWPCRTLWPISMFSRIFATLSIAMPATHAGVWLAKTQAGAAGDLEAALDADHAADVGRVLGSARRRGRRRGWRRARGPARATSSSVRCAAATGRTAGCRRSLARTGRRRRVVVARPAPRCRRAGATSASGSVRGQSVMGGAPQMSRWTGPAAAETQVWMSSPFVPVHLAGAQVADLAGEQGDEAAAGRCPCGNRWA